MNIRDVLPCGTSVFTYCANFYIDLAIALLSRDHVFDEPTWTDGT